MQYCAHQWWYNHVEVLQVPILWIPEAGSKHIHQELVGKGRGKEGRREGGGKERGEEEEERRKGRGGRGREGGREEGKDGRETETRWSGRWSGGDTRGGEYDSKCY